MFSVELIREAALLEQVMAVRKEFNTDAKVSSIAKKGNGAVVRSFSKNALRIAVWCFADGCASVYKYSVTTTSSVYDQNFSSFDLDTSRGDNNDGDTGKSLPQ